MPLRAIESLADLQSLVGQEVAVSDWLVVTQAMIDAFADVTRDPQWLHVDLERAKIESPYGTTIAHGYLTLSLLTYLLEQSIAIRADFVRSINYGLNRVRFPAAVLTGARIRARIQLQEVVEIDGGIQLNWFVAVETDGNPKPVLVAELLHRFYR